MDIDGDAILGLYRVVGCCNAAASRQFWRRSNVFMGESFN